MTVTAVIERLENVSMHIGGFMSKAIIGENEKPTTVSVGNRHRSAENDHANSALKYLRTHEGKSFGTQYPSEWQRRSDFPVSS